MRYILRNIRLFMTNQRGIYLLSIAAVMSSVFFASFFLFIISVLYEGKGCPECGGGLAGRRASGSIYTAG